MSPLIRVLLLSSLLFALALGQSASAPQTPTNKYKLPSKDELPAYAVAPPSPFNSLLDWMDVLERNEVMAAIHSDPRPPTFSAQPTAVSFLQLANEEQAKPTASASAGGELPPGEFDRYVYPIAPAEWQAAATAATAPDAAAAAASADPAAAGAGADAAAAAAPAEGTFLEVNEQTKTKQNRARLLQQLQAKTKQKQHQKMRREQHKLLRAQQTFPSFGAAQGMRHPPNERLGGGGGGGGGGAAGGDDDSPIYILPPIPPAFATRMNPSAAPGAADAAAANPAAGNPSQPAPVNPPAAAPLSGAQLPTAPGV